MSKGEIHSQAWIDKIEELVQQAESLSDEKGRGIAIELLRAVLDFHGAGLERVMEIAAECGAGPAFIERVATDDLTSSMLLLHDLHPHELETRIDRAVQKLQDVFCSLGATLSLVAIEPRAVRLRFDSARTWSENAVKAAVEKVLFQAAPEIESVTVEGVKESSPANFVPLSELLAGSQV